MATMTVQPATIERLYHRPNMHEMSPIAQSANPKAKHLIDLTHDHYISQLSPGQKLDSLNHRFLKFMEKELDLARLPIDAHQPNSSRAHTVSLLRWCRDVMVKSNTNVFFGERLLQIDPDLPMALSTFDDNHWMILYKMPSLMARRVRSSQERIKADFRKYLSLPRHERPGEAWLVRNMEDGMRSLDLNDDEIATQLMLVHWS